MNEHILWKHMSALASILSQHGFSIVCLILNNDLGVTSLSFKSSTWENLEGENGRSTAEKNV